MARMVRCLPGTGNDHKPLQHDDCVRDWYASLGWKQFNTHTCLTDPSRLDGGPSVERHRRLCGPHCPGPGSDAVQQLRGPLRAAQRKHGGQ